MKHIALISILLATSAAYAAGLKNLPATTEPRINIEDHLAWPKEIGDAVVALWHDNATGVLTITNDDNAWARANEKWLALNKKYPRIKYSFYVHGPFDNIPEADKEAWKALVAAGNEVQSHSVAHYDPTKMKSLTEEETRFEYDTPIRPIEEVTGKKVKTIAYNWGWGNHDIAKDYYIAARGVIGTPNQAAIVDYLNTNSISGLGKPDEKNRAAISPDGETSVAEGFIKTVFDKDYKAWGQNYYGGWLSVHYHGLEGGNAEALDEILEKIIMPAVDAGKLWVATFTDAAMYGQQRDTATLKVTRNTAKEIAFDLTSKMDTELFDHPLTVKVRVPNDWKAVSAKQAGKPIETRLVEHDGNKFAFAQAVPSRGETVLTP